jgi:hypothetical protein
VAGRRSGCRPRRLPDVLLGDPAASDGDVAESFALETPNRVHACGQVGIDAGDELPGWGAPATDHGVDMMVAGHPGRSQVDLGAEVALVGVEHESADIPADVEHEELRLAVPGGGAVERGFDGSARRGTHQGELRLLESLLTGVA